MTYKVIVKKSIGGEEFRVVARGEWSGLDYEPHRFLSPKIEDIPAFVDEEIVKLQEEMLVGGHSSRLLKSHPPHGASGDCWSGGAEWSSWARGGDE